MTSGASAINSVGVVAIAFVVPCAPANIELHVAAMGPAQFPQPLHKCSETSLSLGVALANIHEDIDPPDLRLLRVRSERPGRGQTANCCDEIAPPHLSPQTPRD